MLPTAMYGIQIGLCLPDAEGDVLFLIHAGHEDGKIKVDHSPVSLSHAYSYQIFAKIFVS